ENNQKIYKKDNFYIISIEIVFFSLIQELYVPDSVLLFSFIIFLLVQLKQIALVVLSIMPI
ncbi:MAG: hypothetical protein E6X68_08800, partial [Staphylococcus haemolyticus]|nr:hypothetical protein [Staphylococcus haemolyticus]MDU6195808.1 hypothetical protein [Staphylococcus haemolyticus]MDU6278126.1 hypothetical protein [Staphylococcus haemolyticus]